MTSASSKFGKADRLRHSREFIGIQRDGVRYQSGHFVLYGHAVDPERRSRLGITVSRRVGNAVKRNRVKRCLREYYRLKLRTILPEGAEVVIIARAGAAQLASARIDLELMAGAGGLLRRLEGNLKSGPV